MAKSLLDFDEYKTALNAFNALQAEMVASRERQMAIDAEVTAKLTSPVANRRLYEEREKLARREGELLEELEAARQLLDQIRGRVSLELCKPARPQFIAEIKKIESSIRQIIQANRRLVALRDDLEKDGVSTGSLGMAACVIGGVLWNDEFPIVAYARQIADGYPELR